MTQHLNIGDTVVLKRLVHGQSSGQIVSVFGMVSAAGIKRTKWVVQLRHSRTKSRTVELAMELEDFKTWY